MKKSKKLQIPKLVRAVMHAYTISKIQYLINVGIKFAEAVYANI